MCVLVCVCSMFWSVCIGYMSIDVGIYWYRCVLACMSVCWICECVLGMCVCWMCEYWHECVLMWVCVGLYECVLGVLVCWICECVCWMCIGMCVGRGAWQQIDWSVGSPVCGASV